MALQSLIMAGNGLGKQECAYKPQSHHGHCAPSYLFVQWGGGDAITPTKTTVRRPILHRRPKAGRMTAPISDLRYRAQLITMNNNLAFRQTL
jgi:hypothetical protein